jgi:hypothetical protein
MITLSIGRAPAPGSNSPLPSEGRTRGPVAPLAAGTGEDGQPLLTFAELLEELRQQTSYMPLTIIIHGWGGREARHFFETIAPSLGDTDAVWVAPLFERGGGASATASPIAPSEFSAAHTTVVEGAVTLRLDDPGGYPSDERIYANLFGDLIFFPAAERCEEARAAGFRRRARAVLVHAEGAFAENVSKAAEAVGLTVCLWPGEPKAGGVAAPSGVVASAVGIDDALVGEVGAALTEMAAYLRDDFARRQYLRAEIVRKVGEYPEHTRWGEALVLQAHKHGWEEWAVDCLPALYVPLGDADGGPKALAWHYVVKCVPERHAPRVLEELCGGVFLLVEAGEKADGYMRMGAGIFEEQLRNFPYLSERSFKDGAVNNALLYIELALGNEDEEASRRVRRLRQELLSQDQIVS